MKRILTLITIALLVAPLHLFALGLGSIETSSGLNAPFEARIKLIGPTAQELSTLQVTLADNEAFRRAGVERPFYLTQLRFEIVESPRGPAFIRISSADPIREPFLNFLIEVNWSNGRLFREYTVLLDPPLYDPTGRRLAQPAPAPRTAPRQTPSGPEPPPQVIHEEPPSAVPPPTTAYVPPATTSAPAPRIYDYDGRETVRGDTLWAIALSTRPDRSVSIQQTMLAILRANPEAFFLDGNINALKTGYVLRIPDRDEIASLSTAEAIAQVAQHNSLWEDYRERVAGGVTPRPQGAEVSTGGVAGAAESASGAGSESPTTAKAGSGTEPTVVYDEEPEGRLELVSPSEKGAEGTVSDLASSDPQALRDELALMSEMLEAKEQENKDLLERLEEAETIIEELRRLVALKEDDLAKLQAGLGEPGAETTPAVVDETGTVEQPLEEPLAGEMADETVTEHPDEAVGEPLAEETEEEVVPQETATMEGEGLAEGVEPEPLAEAMEPLAGPETAEPAEAELPEPPPAALPPPPQPGFLDRLNSFVPAGLRGLIPGGVLTIIGVFIGLVLVLAGLLFKLLGREKAEIISEEELMEGLAGVSEVTDQDSMEPITEVEEEERTQIELETGAAFESEIGTGEIEVEAEDTVTFQQTLADTELSTTMPTSPEVEDATEIEVEPAEDLGDEDDPLAEVNVYLAYERFDQAEQLVKQAIADYPNEHKYKLRLLEVYYSANNLSGFEQTARSLHDAVNGSGPLWESAVAMWQEMSPNRELFAGGAAEVQEEPVREEADEDAMSATMIMPPGTAQTATFKSSTANVDVPLDASAEGGSLDFDLEMEDITGGGEVSGGIDESEAATFQSQLDDDLDSAKLDATAEELLGESTGGDSPKVVDLSAEGDLDELFDSTVDPEDRYAQEHDLLDVSATGDTSGLEQEDILDITGTGSKRSASADDEELFDFSTSLAQLEASLSATTDNAQVVEFDVGGSEDITERNAEDELEEAPDFLDITGEHPIPQSLTSSGGAPKAEAEEDALEFDVGDLDLSLESSLIGDNAEEDEANPLDLSASVGGTDVFETTGSGRGSAAERSAGADLDASLSLGGDASFDLTGSGFGLESEQTSSSDLDLILDVEDDTARTGDGTAGGETVELPGAQLSSLETEGDADESLDDLAKQLEETVSGLKAESADDEISLDLEIEPDLPSAVPEAAETLALDEVPSSRPSEETVKVAQEESDEQTFADEVDTKLNLAKAYIELGDTEGAKAILSEVTSEGSDEQKRQAAELMSELG
jgi:pilus assembly protein FimV